MEFRILGPLEVLDGDERIEIAGSKRRTVLALLVLRANEVVRTERLVDELWSGERPPANAIAALHNHVSRLRKALGPDIIVSREWGYTLRTAPDTIDLFTFNRLLLESDPLPAKERSELLAQALALWRGPTLADLATEPALDREIAQLEELRISTIERRLDADLESGRSSELIGELETLIAQQPLREHLRSQLILALYRAGRQAEALEVYRETRRVLSDELGLEPSPELRELEKAILRQDPSLARPPTLPRPPTATGDRPPLPPASKRRRWLAGGIAGVLLVAIGVAAGIALVVAHDGKSHTGAPSAGLVDTLDRTDKAVTVADSFAGNQINERVWSQDRSGTGWSMREHGGQLEFRFTPRTRPGGIYHQFGGHVSTQCAFRQDFDARVEFALQSWPAWNGVYVSLTAFLGPEYDSYMAGRTSQVSGGEQYTSQTGFSSNFATDDRAGALRVARRHGVVTTYRLSGRHWRKMTSARDTEFARIAVGVQGNSAREFGGRPVVVDFTNFMVTGSSPICPPGAATSG